MGYPRAGHNGADWALSTPSSNNAAKQLPLHGFLQSTFMDEGAHAPVGQMPLHAYHIRGILSLGHNGAKNESSIPS